VTTRSRPRHAQACRSSWLIGFDRRELVTIPPLHNAARWDALDAARQALLSDIKQERAAERYLTVS
jgi:hypothetical protein